MFWMDTAIGFFMVDPLYIMMVAPCLLLAMLAQLWVKASFARYSRVRAARGMSGADAARRILDSQGIHDVAVEISPGGMLSDHYDPSARVLRLSPEVYHGRSLAALGVAAHEAGHAVQHAFGYAPLHMRTMLVPAVTLGGYVAPLMVILGAAMQHPALVLIGLLGFAAITVFSLVTLPVEINASGRAMQLLLREGIIYDEEAPGAKAVLRAAAMTYIAAAIQAIVILLYYVMRYGGILQRRED
ncbi:MAG: zinc metallopeptidase [Planctomycetota bacterium]|nr:zinc metallopeptidase [Planctomycetota bacterium]